MPSSGIGRLGLDVQEILDDVTADVCETETPRLVLIRQFGVVHSEASKDGCVKIVDVNRILDYIVTVIIRLAVSLTSFDATAGHPNCEAREKSRKRSGNRRYGPTR